MKKLDYLQVLGLSAASLLVLFLLTKLVGNKQISQMSMFDYVVGITIGSVAAEMATGIDKNGWIAVVAMAVYALFAAAISLTSNHSLKLRRIFRRSHNCAYVGRCAVSRKILTRRDLTLMSFFVAVQTERIF